MRKFLVAVSLVGVFALIADTASARGRIGRVVSSKPAPVKTVPKPEAARAAERPSTPRTWIVATPRPAAQPASVPVAAANISDDESRGRYEASWGAMPSAGSSGPAAATDAPPGEPAAAASAQAESAPQAPSRVVALNTAASPKPARVAPAQPREVVVCYWNRTGQCVP